MYLLVLVIIMSIFSTFFLIWLGLLIYHCSKRRHKNEAARTAVPEIQTKKELTVTTQRRIEESPQPYLQRKAELEDQERRIYEVATRASRIGPDARRAAARHPVSPSDKTLPPLPGSRLHELEGEGHLQEIGVPEGHSHSLPIA